MSEKITLTDPTTGEGTEFASEEALENHLEAQEAEVQSVEATV